MSDGIKAVLGALLAIVITMAVIVAVARVVVGRAADKAEAERMQRSAPMVPTG